MAAAPGGEGIIGVPVCIRGARVILVEETRTIDLGGGGTALQTAREGSLGKFRRENFPGGLSGGLAGAGLDLLGIPPSWGPWGF